MARCPVGCDFTDEIHDFGCAARQSYYRDPALSHLYATETPKERGLLDRLLMHLLVDAGFSEWDPEEVDGGEPEWLVLRQRIRELGPTVLDRALPLRVEWNTDAEAPSLRLIEGVQ